MGGVTYLLVAQCPSIVPIVVIYAKTVNVVVWVPGVITGNFTVVSSSDMPRWTRVRICAETYGLAITFGSARC